MISSLVVHLDLDERRAAEAISLILTEPAIEAGARQANRLPIVLECPTPAASQRITEWLLGLRGVTHVDLTFVHLAPIMEGSQESSAS